MLLGRGPVVGRQVRTAVKKWGPRPPQGFDPGEMTDAEEAPQALILVDQTDRNRSSTDFHCYAFAHAVMDQIDDTRIVDQWFQWWLEAPWSTAGLLGSAGGSFFTQALFLKDGSRSNCPEQFLRALARHLDVLEKVGPRFKMLTTTGDVASLKVCLHHELLQEKGFPAASSDIASLRDALRRYLASLDV